MKADEKGFLHPEIDREKCVNCGLCAVKDVKLIAPDDSYDAHAAIYTTGSDSLFNEAEGVTVSNVTFEAL